MDKKTAQTILNRIEQIVEMEFPEMRGKMSVKRFDSASVSFKMELVEEDSVNERAQRDFETGCFKNGVKFSCQGKVFEHNGLTYRVENVKTRKCKMPVLCRNLDNRRMYKFPASFINEVISNS